MEQKNAFLGAAPVGTLMRAYALPCVISLLVGALYHIVTLGVKRSFVRAVFR